MIDVKHVVPVTLLVQVCVSFVAALAFWAGMDATAGKSALLGGIAVVIPNGFLAARLLRSAADLSMFFRFRLGSDRGASCAHPKRFWGCAETT